MEPSPTYLRLLGKRATASHSSGFTHRMRRIMGGTIRDNILFSHHYDETFYDLVLDGERHHFGNYALTNFEPTACALRPDLALLSNGDMTEVGERGITVRNAVKTARNCLTRPIVEWWSAGSRRSCSCYLRSCRLGLTRRRTGRCRCSRGASYLR